MSQIVIIDIGSTSVGGLIFNSDAPGKVVFTTRHSVNFQENINLPQFLSGINQTLRRTVAELRAKSVKRPSRVVCFLSAPFYASSTSKIKKQEAEPFMITERLTDEMIEKRIQEFKRRQSNLFASNGSSPHEILESAILQIKANGYLLDNPYKQKARELEIAHYLSICSGKILEQFRKIIRTEWYAPEPEFHSFALSFYKVLREVVPSQDNFLVIDIGGEITEISLIWQNIICETVSFPLGCNWLVRFVTREFATTPVEAQSSLSLYLEGRQNKSTSDKFNAVLSKAKKEWLLSFRGALDRALDNCFLPENIFAIGNFNLVPLFRNWLEDEDLEGLMLGNQRLNVNMLQENVFSSHCADNLIHDLSLMIEVIFCDKIKITKK